MRLPPLMLCLGLLSVLSLQARAQGTDPPRGPDAGPASPSELPALPPAAVAPELAPPQSLPRVAPPPPYYPPPPPPPPPKPGEVRSRMPLSPPEPDAYLHDGFYLRLGLGAGRVAETIEWTPEGGATSSIETVGLGVPIDLAMGGTLGKGFVLGGVLHNMLLGREDLSHAPLPESARGGQHALSVVGLYADWYVEPQGGLHVQGMLGAGSLLLSDTSNDDYAPVGTSTSVGVGYDWWIGPDSSLGMLARIDWVSLTYTDDEAGVDYDHRLLHVGLMGTATYH